MGINKIRTFTNSKKYGGERGIRTPGRLAPTTVFKTAALSHSAISPDYAYLRINYFFETDFLEALTVVILDFCLAFLAACAFFLFILKVRRLSFLPIFKYLI